MIDLLRKIAIFFNMHKLDVLNYSVEKQRKYLKRFPEPDSLIQRAFCQYQCQMKLNGYLYKIGANIIAFFMVAYYLLKSRRYKTVEKDFFENKAENRIAVQILNGDVVDIIPNSLKNEFLEIKVDPDSSSYLTKEDKKFIWKIWKQHPFSWFFLFKIIYKIATYRGILDEFHPKAIIVCTEYSFTSSAMTEYLRRNNVLHINIMHGEKLFYIRDTFFEFDRCYIWNSFYEELFQELRAAKGQFIIEIPNSLKIEKRDGIEKDTDYKYYLSYEKKKELKKIVASLGRLKEKGYNISIRPHPRYSDSNLVKCIFKEYTIEDGKQITIEDSIRKTYNAISLYSTTLNQAYHSGVGVVIDDLTDANKYLKLKERKYCMLNIEHKLLSEIINEAK